MGAPPKPGHWRNAALCRERNLWFHVDGAYGGIAAMVPEVTERALLPNPVQRAEALAARLEAGERAAYVRMIADDMVLARRLHDLLALHPEFETLTQNLSVTTFRWVPESLRSSIGTER